MLFKPKELLLSILFVMISLQGSTQVTSEKGFVQLPIVELFIPLPPDPNKEHLFKNGVEIHLIQGRDSVENYYPSRFNYIRNPQSIFYGDFFTVLRKEEKQWVKDDEASNLFFPYLTIYRIEQITISNNHLFTLTFWKKGTYKVCLTNGRYEAISTIIACTDEFEI